MLQKLQTLPINIHYTPQYDCRGIAWYSILSSKLLEKEMNTLHVTLFLSHYVIYRNKLKYPDDTLCYRRKGM